MVDALDCKALEHLSMNGRMTWAELANVLGLSSPSAAERIKKLEEKGIINGYSANLNYKVLGYSVTAFIAFSLSHPKHQAEFLEKIHRMEEVEECHHITGEDDYLLKVRCKSTDDLDLFLNEKLKIIPGISRTRTTIVLSTSKDSKTKKIISN